MLNGWLSPPEGKWKLPFPGSRDGFQAETFHSKRDNKGPTVTVVKSGNYVFGEFAEISWDSKYVSCDRVKYWYFWSHLAALNNTFLVEGYFKIPKITKRNETTRRNKDRKSLVRIFGIAKVKEIRMKYQ